MLTIVGSLSAEDVLTLDKIDSTDYVQDTQSFLNSIYLVAGEYFDL